MHSGQPSVMSRSMWVHCITIEFLSKRRAKRVSAFKLNDAIPEVTNIAQAPALEDSCNLLRRNLNHEREKQPIDGRSRSPRRRDVLFMGEDWQRLTDSASDTLHSLMSGVLASFVRAPIGTGLNQRVRLGGVCRMTGPGVIDEL
jgi:hypothetical protein